VMMVWEAVLVSLVWCCSVSSTSLPACPFQRLDSAVVRGACYISPPADRPVSLALIGHSWGFRLGTRLGTDTTDAGEFPC